MVRWKVNSAIILIFGLLLVTFHSVLSYRILLVSPQITSHVMKQADVGSALLKAGHEVHIVLQSKFDQKLVKKFSDEGFQFHFFEEPNDFMRFSSEKFRMFLEDKIFNRTLEFFSEITDIGRLVNEECDYMMRDQNFLRKIENIKFDLVIVEPFLLHMCSVILPKYLKTPFVSLSCQYIALNVRYPALPSFSSRHFNSADIRKDNSFFIRFATLIATIFLSTSWSPMNRNLTLLHKYAPGIDSWEDLMREALLFFYEVDHHFNNFIPAFPNHISIAGSTCSPAKPLPENILKFINGRFVDGKDHGVIVMTFGATADMPKEFKKKFLKAFRLFNETVLAKLAIDEDDEELKSLIPPNTLILNWLPQNDVLGLPSTKLFITHCGNNGIHESLYHGVPMLGFPLFAEQGENCRRMIAFEFGIKMDIFTFTETELVENAQEILKNPKYKNSIRRMSEAFKNQPMAPLQRALFWMEHVIKHGGTHLRCSAMDLALYQFLCFDTIALLLLIITIVTFVVFQISKFVLRYLYNFYANHCPDNKKKSH